MTLTLIHLRLFSFGSFGFFLRLLSLERKVYRVVSYLETIDICQLVINVYPVCVSWKKCYVLVIVSLKESSIRFQEYGNQQ